MYTEHEATFTKVGKESIRKQLINAGARLIHKEFLQKRVVFNLPKGHEIKGGWLRVRDEDGRITMSLKAVKEGKIVNQKETQLTVDSFENAVDFLVNIGCVKKAYQESKRELWSLDNTEVTIDEWPFLEPFVEIEGKSEKEVKTVSEKLGFDYKKAKFCAVDALYSERYGMNYRQLTQPVYFNSSFACPKSSSPCLLM